MSDALTIDRLLDSLPTLRPRGSDHGAPLALTSDLAWFRTGIVNVAFIGEPDAGDRGWILVDTGIPGYTENIVRAAEKRYGAGVRPAAIVLTHGHFDHVGSATALAQLWDVPIYAHRLEMPYISGRSAYAPPDPTVGGGGMARMASLYPRGPVSLGNRVQVLPADGTVPFAPDWRWINTAGHSPGHVSLFREQDRALIAGDAFVTTKQESVVSVISQRIELHGPPMYFTSDWDLSRASVRMLAELEPALAITGHGQPMQGDDLRAALHELADAFDDVARPVHGRYRDRAAVTDESGVLLLPPPVPDPTKLALALGAIAAIGLIAFSLRRRPTDDMLATSSSARRIKGRVSRRERD
ncbi:MAG TPA: MBL fold metallo-hydrolase [Gemmatimonadaceae bacterium]|nr:MBL fold metallo-hydrolase [Gemmatimonadaceae bacterium]